MRTKIFIILIFAFALLQPITGQNKSKKVAKTQITATVVNEAGLPLEGVLISANEGKFGTTTDEMGSFTLSVPKNSLVSFDIKGYDSVIMSLAEITAIENSIMLVKNKLKNVYTDVILPYNVKAQYRSSGSVATVIAQEELDRDYRTSIGNAINNKVSGLNGLVNIHGFGNGGVVVVDGLVSNASSLTLQEVESITVLKDAASRMLYGASADKGVVMIKTKRGEKNKRSLRFEVESGIQSAISYPKFLGSADYMQAYNQAAVNDNGPGYEKYLQTDIDYMRQPGIDPVLYPDVDYYSSEWVNQMVNFQNIYGEASGGNDKVQYFMNLGWKNNEGWIAASDNDRTNVFNVRGKVDFIVNDWLKMYSDVTAIYDIDRSPDTDFWKSASTYLPNTSPLLIPISQVSNLDALGKHHLIDDKYLLGASVDQQGNLFGALNVDGGNTTTQRQLEFKVGLEIDLNKITKGLTFSAAGSYQFYNYYSSKINNNYATYAVVNSTYSDDTGYSYELSKFGLDEMTTKKTVSISYFERAIQAFSSLNYDRTFGDHYVNAVAVANFNQSRVIDIFQEDRAATTGFQASYMFQDKYLIDFGFLTQGSKKFNLENRWATAPTIGAAWVLTNEKFMKKVNWLNYFKLRGSYGTILNDNWNNYGSYNGYFLYEPIYQKSNVYTYSNGNRKNDTILINSAGNNYGWQSRNELTLGFDSYLFDNSIWLEASYFNSTTADMLTEMSNSTPETMGAAKVYANYNSTNYSGVEFGIKYSEKFGDLALNLGLNYMYTYSTILKKEEFNYDTDLTKHLVRTGTANNALYSLEALGLYLPEDFDSVTGDLLKGQPIPSWGNVQPGDIKYQDYNNDLVINENDVHDIGLKSSNNHNLSFNVELKYKKWQLFAMMTAGFGGYGYKNSAYYWFKGQTAKYSEFATEAYNEIVNPDPNANCPRLTLGQGSNNYRNSTFWLYDKSYINLGALQLSYSFNTNSVMKGAKIYLRGSNLFTLAKDLKHQQLNYIGNPQSRLIALGIVTSF